MGFDSRCNRTCGLWFLAGKQKVQAESRGGAKINDFIFTGRIPGGAQNIAIGIARTMKKNNLSVGDIHRLDFSWPGEPKYGDDPMLEVYSIEGGQLTPPRVTEKDLKSSWNKYYSESNRYIITLGNRAKDTGSDKTELMAILPKVREISCELINRVNDQPIESVTIPKIEKLNLTPHPVEVPEEDVITLPSRYGCIDTPDGYYYYHVLLER